MIILKNLTKKFCNEPLTYPSPPLPLIRSSILSLLYDTLAKNWSHNTCAKNGAADKKSGVYGGGGGGNVVPPYSYPCTEYPGKGAGLALSSPYYVLGPCTLHYTMLIALDQECY